jgi:hypothetical protein
MILSWMRKRRDLAASWRMYADDAAHNSGELPRYAVTGPVMDAFAAAVWSAIDETDGFGVGATPGSLCAALADTGARVASLVTGDRYRVQSGWWARVAGIEGSKLSWLERTGSGQDFHAWTVCAQPGRRLVMFDPQSLFWEDDGRLVWNWAHNLQLIGWRAHTATTARVIALADEHRDDVCDRLYEAVIAELSRCGLLPAEREAAA